VEKDSKSTTPGSKEVIPDPGPASWIKGGRPEEKEHSDELPSQISRGGKVKQNVDVSSKRQKRKGEGGRFWKNKENGKGGGAWWGVLGVVSVSDLIMP